MKKLIRLYSFAEKCDTLLVVHTLYHTKVSSDVERKWFFARQLKFIVTALNRKP